MGGYNNNSYVYIVACVSSVNRRPLWKSVKTDKASASSKKVFKNNNKMRCLLSAGPQTTQFFGAKECKHVRMYLGAQHAT